MSQNKTGVSFFNPWGDEQRCLISHITEDDKLFIHLIRYYDDKMSAVSITLDAKQVEKLYALINSYHDHLKVQHENERI